MDTEIEDLNQEPEDDSEDDSDIIPSNPGAAFILKASASSGRINRLTGKSTRTLKLLDIMDKVRAEILKDNARPTDIASLAKAYCGLEDTLRVLRGESKPANISVSSQLDKVSKRTRGTRIVDVESVVRSLSAKPVTPE